MKLYFLSETSLEILKGNIKLNLRKYTNTTNDWIYDYFNDKSPFIEYKVIVNDFTLDMSSDKPEETDVENIKRIYTNMISLTETQATDERLWSGLEHGIFWDYMQYRWQMNKKLPSESEINSRFFFGQSKRRSLLTNTISRLWWIGKLTYDDNRKNPFELTEYLKYDFATKILMLFSSNYSSNPTIVRALLSSLLDLERKGTTIDRETFREVTKYLNVLGGTYILDYLDEEVLKDKITNQVTKLIS
ncbi:hypothetical protein GJ688_18055 [Heliobacillus mobilis]|uniref:Uncharacterized protein n=1 Tax=Heliobacterium mobile TaxID=28064 RepID=A0A6I3SP88_HELMO|nr:DUF6339 family protein [Heliobacterium mobile]MTV50838.1 hypothetical protein [Heliobacterium mobile]